MYVCVCHGIRDRDLRQAIAAGRRCFEELQSCTGVATGCGACEQLARELLDAARQQASESQSPVS
jgi:bacterioferritin-associated ferredoxin